MISFSWLLINWLQNFISTELKCQKIDVICIRAHVYKYASDVRRVFPAPRFINLMDFLLGGNISILAAPSFFFFLFFFRFNRTKNYDFYLGLKVHFSAFSILFAAFGKLLFLWRFVTISHSHKNLKLWRRSHVSRAAAAPERCFLLRFVGGNKRRSPHNGPAGGSVPPHYGTCKVIIIPNISRVSFIFQGTHNTSIKRGCEW